MQQLTRSMEKKAKKSLVIGMEALTLHASKLLKSKLVKFIITKVFKATIKSGPLNFMVSFIVEKLFKKFVYPFTKTIVRKAKKLVNKKAGKKTQKEIDDAKKNNDIDSYRDNIGGV